MSHPAQHPPWCHVPVCDDDHHMSVPIIVPSTPESPTRTLLRLASWPAMATAIVVEYIDAAPLPDEPSDICSVVLSLNQAAGMVAALAQLVDLHDGTGR